MTKRNDIHSPSNLVPADYTELFPYAHATTVDGWPVPGFNISLLCAQRTGRPFYAASDASKGEVQPFRDDAGRPYPMAACHKGGACDSCGAWHVYGSVFLHEPTGECIAVGWQCAEKLDMDLDARRVHELKARRQNAREQVATLVRRRAALREFVRGLREADDKALLADLRTDHYIVRDIRAKLIRNAAKYGASLTEKQVALVQKLAREQAEKAQRDAERAAEKKGEVVEGRQVVRGEVVSKKWHDNGYGGREVMTVKLVAADGAVTRLWGTVPASLDAERGATVEFTATVQRSDRDPAFGFFKRPTKARVLEGAAS